MSIVDDPPYDPQRGKAIPSRESVPRGPAGPAMRAGLGVGGGESKRTISWEGNQPEAKESPRSSNARAPPLPRISGSPIQRSALSEPPRKHRHAGPTSGGTESKALTPRHAS